MVLEIKSICCMESLKKIPEVFGLENGKSNVFILKENNFFHQLRNPWKL